MAPLPRNVRTKTPRPVTLRPPPSVRRPDITPTPPPVVVAAPDAPEAAVVAPPPRLARWLGALFLLLGVCGSAWAWRAGVQDRLSALVVPARAMEMTPGAVRAGAPEPADPPARPRDGWTIKHDGHVPLDGGVLLTPLSFAPDGDDYDLVIHFHGDVQIVRESIEHAGVNAALAVINWGISSGPYREPYQRGGAFEKLLAQIDQGLTTRGLRKPKLRRLALISWSAGYGAIESVLENRVSPPPDDDPLDAIIALDGVHAGFVDRDPGRLAPTTIHTFVNAARAAVEGQIMLSLTHSEITPPGYAGTKRSQLYILDRLGIKPRTGPMLALPEHLSLPAAKGAAPGGADEHMIPMSDTRRGMLRVQGFKGDTKAHHTAHLTQMAAVALPDLVARWSGPRERVPVAIEEL